MLLICFYNDFLLKRWDFKRQYSPRYIINLHKLHPIDDETHKLDHLLIHNRSFTLVLDPYSQWPMQELITIFHFFSSWVFLSGLVWQSWRFCFRNLLWTRPPLWKACGSQQSMQCWPDQGREDCLHQQKWNDPHCRRPRYHKLRPRKHRIIQLSYHKNYCECFWVYWRDRLPVKHKKEV